MASEWGNGLSVAVRMYGIIFRHILARQTDRRSLLHVYAFGTTTDGGTHTATREVCQNNSSYNAEEPLHVIWNCKTARYVSVTELYLVVELLYLRWSSGLHVKNSGKSNTNLRRQHPAALSYSARCQLFLWDQLIHTGRRSSYALISTLLTELCRELVACQGQITSGIGTSDHNARTQNPSNVARTSASSVQFILLNRITSADALNMQHRTSVAV